MNFKILYHKDVKHIDLPKVSKEAKIRIRKAIEERLLTKPERYGIPLRGTLKGYWKLRVGNYRIVYKIEKSTIIILGIRHRKDIYKEVIKRFK